MVVVNPGLVKTFTPFSFKKSTDTPDTFHDNIEGPVTPRIKEVGDALSVTVGGGGSFTVTVIVLD